MIWPDGAAHALVCERLHVFTGVLKKWQVAAELRAACRRLAAPVAARPPHWRRMPAAARKARTRRSAGRVLYCSNGSPLPKQPVW
eukprot:scaffold2045_cov404-Prasinococcus_capsulatus_cf.AAC.29